MSQVVSRLTFNLNGDILAAIEMIWKSFMLNNTIPNISESSTAAYISKVYKIEYINREDERKLLKAYITDNDMVARETLINANLGNVINLARTLNGYKVSFSDLIQEGNVGLIKALNKFSLEHDVRFYTFAIHYIRAHMFDFIVKNHKIFNIATTKPLRKLFFGLRRYKTHSGFFTEQEITNISKELKVKPSEVKQMEERLLAHSVVSLDAPIATYSSRKPNEEHLQTPAETLASDTLTSDEEVIKSDTDHHLHDMLYTSLKTLDTRSKDIVRRRWLYDEKTTLSVLSKEYGVSMERIRQIEAQALRKMRTWMVN